ncbi:MAG: hypothetical protein NTX52_10745 [Planctomycetota bacterium]|nr:hypothetical protein [Planctomycetota bacterium]
MKFRLKRSVMIFVIMSTMLCGCKRSDFSTNPPPQEKIESTNKIRQKLGIRQIKPNWTFYGREFGAEVWKDGNTACKVVHYEPNYTKILWEYDHYYTGRIIPSGDPDSGLVPERLTISYCYEFNRFYLAVTTDNEAIKAMEQYLEESTPATPEGGEVLPGFTGKTNEETLEVVDKILKMWGLQRL